MAQLNDAITAIKAGDKNRGQRLLEEIIQQNPQDETAWLWLAAAVDNPIQKKAYLQRVLEINPNNATAKSSLSQLETLIEEPRVEDIVPQAYSPKPASGLAPIPPQQPVHSSSAQTPASAQPIPSSQPAIKGWEIGILVIVTSIYALLALYQAYLGKYLLVCFWFTIILGHIVSFFQVWRHRMGKDIFLIRVMRIFMIVLAVGILVVQFAFR